MYDGVADEVTVPDHEVEYRESAGTASVEGCRGSLQRLDETGDLIGKFRYRNIVGSSDVAS
jgi:hypothetical protein